MSVNPSAREQGQVPSAVGPDHASIFCFRMIEFISDMRDAEPQAVGPPIGVELLDVGVVPDDLRDSGCLVADVAEILRSAELNRGAITPAGMRAGARAVAVSTVSAITRVRADLRPR
jgi:hypothetical protein